MSRYEQSKPTLYKEQRIQTGSRLTMTVVLT